VKFDALHARSQKQIEAPLLSDSQRHQRQGYSGCAAHSLAGEKESLSLRNFWEREAFFPLKSSPLPPVKVPMKREKNCELLSTCPYYNHSIYQLAETDKERYCRGDYRWCGRYMIFQAREREFLRESATAETLKTTLSQLLSPTSLPFSCWLA